MGSGHTFSNAAKFRDAVYLMSIASRFRYRFKRNSTKHMTVVCTVTKCPWKVTARAIGDSNIVQDFQRQHGMQLTYLQAWNIKEKANERIYGEPKYYYKLLPWMCEKMVATNPGSIVELGHSSDGHFEQLFVAHSVSIQGFAMGCRPIIAIDSAHMSGPYRGALFSATAYDANDAMFPLAFGVMSSENYDDWSWFLQNLKKLVGDKEVENFSSFLSKHNTRGNKGKENALQFLDSIAYARLEHDYNVSMFELRKYNDALAKWVEENEPEHWAMSKFPKQRWDKMTTNLAESFNAWLRNERHHSICTFLMEHMAKLGSMLVKHKEESNNWKECIGPKIEEKVQQKIAKGEVYPVTPFMNGIFGVSIGTTFLNVDIMKRTCTCRGWEMLGIPCEHAATVILSIGQNVVDFFKIDAASTPYIAIITVKLPKSRCSGKKFLSIMDTLPMDKKNAISDMGFGGLLQLGFTPKDVREVLGIPDNGVDILIYNRRGTPNRTYDIKILEANLRDLPLAKNS
ncbi:hypothetical protein CK203_066201 [Vitis vinifera]|uniref:SWIM-type domain-containing protein n=1 Tax=Vitis vinifera TaxID=29760 RepID=A0A438FNK9_VITVI|nr:hypothetical protein CK203_066201 [Vitis vinifera]